VTYRLQLSNRYDDYLLADRTSCSLSPPPPPPPPLPPPPPPPPTPPPPPPLPFPPPSPPPLAKMFGPDTGVVSCRKRRANTFWSDDAEQTEIRLTRGRRSDGEEERVLEGPYCPLMIQQENVHRADAFATGVSTSAMAGEGRRTSRMSHRLKS